MGSHENFPNFSQGGAAPESSCHPRMCSSGEAARWGIGGAEWELGSRTEEWEAGQEEMVKVLQSSSGWVWQLIGLERSRGKRGGSQEGSAAQAGMTASRSCLVRKHQKRNTVC